MKQKMIAFALAAGLASAAHAAELYVAMGFSVVRGDPATGQFQPLGVCGGSIRSMAQNAQELLLGDAQGVVYRLNTVTGQVVGSFQLPVNNTALAVAGDQLYAAGSDGKVVRANPMTGQVLETRNVPIGDVSAMMIRGGALTTGGASTFVFRRNLPAGSFQSVTACGGAVRSMAFGNGELLLGTVDKLYRVNETSGAYYGVTPLAFDASAIAVAEGAVFVGSADGHVRRVNQASGAVTVPVDLGQPITALIAPQPLGCRANVDGDALLTALDFGAYLTLYRSGSVRADFNNDGVLNALDFGAMLSAFQQGCGSR